MLRIIAAFDSFKGSLTSREAGEAFRRGFMEVHPDSEVTVFSIADGGEGMAEAICEGVGGEMVSTVVSDPLGRKVEARYALVNNGDTAVIAMSAASGLTLLSPEERNPLVASTYGTGELILDALERGCTKVIVGLGGSATNDAGTGMLRALGYRFYDEQGAELCDTISILERVASISTAERHPLLMGVRFTAAVDVDNPLYGDRGAAHIFAPQKGATPAMVERLDMALRHYAEVVDKGSAEVAGAGAAGGMGYALCTMLGARMQPGIDIVLSLLDFERRAKGCDMVVTGEGSIDAQTLHGKAPAGVLAVAQCLGVPVVALGGRVEGEDALLAGGFSDVRAITPRGQTLAEAMQRDVATANMERTARKLALSLGLEV
ncbi:MAG: glycerate kinase [Alistipes sp.]|nr:glycerate kinase [Alistipes sp.]